jgi:hypothetical protein
MCSILMIRPTDGFQGQNRVQWAGRSQVYFLSSASSFGHESRSARIACEPNGWCHIAGLSLPYFVMIAVICTGVMAFVQSCNRPMVLLGAPISDATPRPSTKPEEYTSRLLSGASRNFCMEVKYIPTVIIASSDCGISDCGHSSKASNTVICLMAKQYHTLRKESLDGDRGFRLVLRRRASCNHCKTNA